MTAGRLSALALAIGTPALMLVFWEVFARTDVLNPLFFPPPSEVAGAWWRLLRHGGLGSDVRISLVRLAVGFVLGAVLGVSLGMAMGLWGPVRSAVLPTVNALYPIPRIAILPLVLVVFGIGETSTLMIVAISIFFLVALNTMSGVLEIDPSYRDVARNLGASRWELFWTVALPGALPAIFTGMRLSLGFALIVIVGTEFLAAKQGIGYLIWQSYQTLRMQQMFVGLVITGIMGWALTLLLNGIEHLVMPWRAND